MRHVSIGQGGLAVLASWIVLAAGVAGCAVGGDQDVTTAVARYAANEQRALDLEARGSAHPPLLASAGTLSSLESGATGLPLEGSGTRARPRRADAPLTLGLFFAEDAAQSQPTSAALAAAGAAPPGYWRQDLLHQMGREAADLGSRDLWMGFKHSFWDLENALILSGVMGASIAIRETGVDGTIRNRIDGHQQMGSDFDEAIQLLGHPGVHFASAGVLWLGSTMMQDVKTHEFSRSLTQALAVNGISTIVLKVTADTRAPDNEKYAWPSGHTSSAFTVAAVVNEYYGPWAGVPAIALAGLVGYQRLDSQVHDFSDVVFGGFMGYIVGASIAREDKIQFPELFGMKLIPFNDPETGATGLALWKSY